MADIFKKAIFSDEIVTLKPASGALPAENISVIPEKIAHDIKEQAREEGYQSGFTQGLADGITKATTEVAEQVNFLTALLHNIPNAISDNRQQLRAEIADIVLTIAQQFFVYQQHDKEAIEQQITHTINQLNEKQNLILSLHPQDLARIKQGDLKIDLKQCLNLRIIPDDTLRLGGCLVKSEHGVFDAGIERQIDSLKQVLLQMKAGECHA